MRGGQGLLDGRVEVERDPAKQRRAAIPFTRYEPNPYPPACATTGNFSYDLGAAVTNTNGGTTLTDTVGGRDPSTNPETMAIGCDMTGGSPGEHEATVVLNGAADAWKFGVS